MCGCARRSLNAVFGSVGVFGAVFGCARQPGKVLICAARAELRPSMSAAVRVSETTVAHRRIPATALDSGKTRNHSACRSRGPWQPSSSVSSAAVPRTSPAHGCAARATHMWCHSPDLNSTRAPARAFVQQTSINIAESFQTVPKSSTFRNPRTKLTLLSLNARGIFEPKPRTSDTASL